MLHHQRTHAFDIALARGIDDVAVVVGVFLAEAAVFGLRRAVAEHDELANHLVDQLAGEAQERIGIGGRKNVVKVHIFAALRDQVSMA